MSLSLSLVVLLLSALPFLLCSAVPHTHAAHYEAALTRLREYQTRQNRPPELKQQQQHGNTFYPPPPPPRDPVPYRAPPPGIETVHLEVKPIPLATNISMHSRRQKHPAAPQGIAPSPPCPQGTGEKLAAKFIVDYNRDNSACPREDWLAAMAEADPFSDKLFVNIGANKGYNLAVWMNVFLPKLEVTPAVWNDSLARVLQNSGDCGVCQDCSASFAVSPQRTPRIFASRAHLTMLAADLNCENLQGIERIVGQIPALSSSLAASPQAERLSLFTACAGLSNVQSRLTMTKCPFAHESCRIGEVVGRRTESVSVPITTADELLRLLLAQLPAHDPPAQEPQPAAAGSEEYRPLVDVLMVDTEGNDYLVLQGAQQLLARRQVRVLIFEYHRFPPWGQYALAAVKDELAGLGFECYFQGQGRLWRITGEGCWSPRFEFHEWSNVMCVQRQDLWHQTLQQFVVSAD